CARFRIATVGRSGYYGLDSW
nr:immunoglobulin heavy chain junction region [Macaca mulatta]MOW19385.1 immunoglobulin heavy chain junction region [Macaca mulatta]MOW20561.1 immunoglobulin heavy chain junction region [Macaca mulatta]MOW20589.1 immunoglobulin heavy chain junction region [Macaca mulatta]MOW21106.1 immunoglobulin heavy chain junction region [Macaca mulatta]